MMQWVLLVLVGVFSLHSGVESQRGFGRGRGGMDPEQMAEMRARMEAVQACPVDQMWSVLTFDIDLDAAQRQKVEAAMRDAHKERKTILAFSSKHDAWDEGRKRAGELRKRTDKRLEAAMDKDQWRAYKKLLDRHLDALRPPRR